MATVEPEVLGVVGRERELATVKELAHATDARAVVLVGGPGIGKTTLWEAGVTAARQAGLRVLSARPSDAEASLAFAGLIDLFDGVETDELAALPAPQRQALEVPLLRATPTGAAPEAGAIGVGLLNALRALAASTPLMVAVDDLQWLDPPSSEALAYASRRLEAHDVRFLLAKRSGEPTPLEGALEPRGLRRLELGPLTLGSLRRVLGARLGLTLPHQLVSRIHGVTVGNPLFALEVGRKLAEEGPPAVGEELPVPDEVGDLLGTRVARLAPDERRLLLAVALSRSVRADQLAGLAEPGALERAVAAGTLVVDDEGVRASHPLLAAAAVGASSASERRGLHRALAALAVVGEVRTRHLALATSEPDATLATTVASAASDAAARGAVQAAAELAEHALRLTPEDDPRREERLLELARYLVLAGEKRRVTDLLVPALESITAGVARSRAYVLLTRGEISGNDDIQRYLEQALAESGDDARSRAGVLAALAENVAAVRIERIEEAESWALEALTATGDAGPEVERLALYALAWTRTLRGRPIDDVCERFRTASPAAAYLAESPERIAGQRLVWRGELPAARGALTPLLAAADERGEPSSYAIQRLHVCELELRAGGWDVAEHLLDEWADSSDRELLHWPMYERCRALLAAGRGQREEARRWGVEALARARASGVRWDEFEAQRAVGIAEMLAGAPDAAAERFAVVWDHAERAGVEDPGVFPVAPELVEALAELGRLEEAEAVTHRLARLSEEQAHPWGLATAKRCASVVGLALRYDESHVTALEASVDDLSGLGLPLDAARTLLSLGRAQRRARKWGAARQTLERATSAFEELGSTGWAETTRGELARAGARRPAKSGSLTPTERRVAELAAEGLANKEIAAALVVTINTVEFHLSNTYAKLGIRSRGQLAARLAELREPSEPS